MAFSKIIMNGETLMDLTQDTVAADKLAKDYTAHKNDGTAVTGTLETDVPTDGDVIFIDYDGTIVNAKTKAQINAMTSDSDLPANPTHTGLTSQGWNWTVAQLKAQLTAMPDQKVYVGQMYVTTSGATEIDVVMQDGRLSPILSVCPDGTISVDWGDETTPDEVTGTSLGTRQSVSHTYANAGSYTIKISKTSGAGYAFNGSSSYTILRKSSSSNQNIVYTASVKNIRIGSDTSIRNYAFYGCNNLESITIPNSVTSIGNDAFENCRSLKSITVPSDITTISAYMLQRCNSINSISIPNNVTTIELYAFDQCYNLSFPFIPNNVTTIGMFVFNNCYPLANVIFPSGVSSIREGMFYNCYSLTSFTIPSSVTSIEKDAFNYCQSLAKITIPSGVTSIGNYAFYNCHGVAEYHVLPTTPPTLGSDVFHNIPSDCVIYVPQGKLSTYQSATGWSDYAAYMQEEPTT